MSQSLINTTNLMLRFKFIPLLLALPFFAFVIPPHNFNGGGKEINLSNFEAISDGKKVIVNWNSAGEKTFDYYTIEKSKDGIHFYPALMIKSAGKMVSAFEYTDIDYSPFSGISYYRLRHNDYFGEYFYSPVIAVNCQINKDGALIPFKAMNPALKELQTIEGKQVLVVVRDNKGNEFTAKIEVSGEGNSLYATDIKNQLAQGEYLVIASSNNSLYHQKLTVK